MLDPHYLRPRRLPLHRRTIEDGLRPIYAGAVDAARRAVDVAALCRSCGDRAAAAANLNLAAGWRLTAAVGRGIGR